MCVDCMHRWYGRVPSYVLLRDIICSNCNDSGAVIITGQPMDFTEE